MAQAHEFEHDHDHDDEGHDHQHHGHSHARAERPAGMPQAVYLALVMGRLILCPGDDILAAGMAAAAPLTHTSIVVEQQEAVLPRPTQLVMLVGGVEVPIE